MGSAADPEMPFGAGRLFLRGVKAPRVWRLETRHPDHYNPLCKRGDFVSPHPSLPAGWGVRGLFFKPQGQAWPPRGESLSWLISICLPILQCQCEAAG